MLVRNKQIHSAQTGKVVDLNRLGYLKSENFKILVEIPPRNFCNGIS